MNYAVIPAISRVSYNFSQENIWLHVEIHTPDETCMLHCKLTLNKKIHLQIMQMSHHVTTDQNI